jgi:TonB-linked SusC/RagA family outer membrane protein
MIKTLYDTMGMASSASEGLRARVAMNQIAHLGRWMFERSAKALPLLMAAVLGLMLTTDARAQEADSPYLTQNTETSEAPRMEGQDYEPLSEMNRLPVQMAAIISVRLKQASLEEAVEHIAAQSELRVMYGQQAIAAEKHITLDKRATVYDALLHVLHGTNLRGILSSSGQLILVDRPEEAEYLAYTTTQLPAQTVHSQPQTGVIAGTVTDSTSGEPLPGVNVVIEGTDQGAATGANGNYRIENVEAGTYSLRASFVSYQDLVQTGVEVQANQTTTVNFALTPATEALDEVVVVGYGQQQRREVTGSITQVSSESLADVQATSPEEALQGLAAGVQVTNSGAPGTGARVRIRGLSTVNNTNPLFIVDGVEVGGLEAVNVSDIESIEVLKDASAAAIYGSRASGGVVLISTKSGQPGELRVNFSSSYGVQRATERLDLLNTAQYVDYTTEMQQNAGLEPPARFDQDGFSENANTDWQDAVFQQGFITNNNLAVSGGSEDATYRLSLGYAREQGTIIETGFERFSLRANSSFNLGPVTLSENLALTYREQDNLRGDILGLAQRMPPYLNVRDPDNPGGYDGLDLVDLADDQNPVRLQELGYSRNSETKIFGNITGEIQLIDGVVLRSVLGADFAEGLGENYTPSFRTGDFQGQNFAEIGENRFTFFQPVSTTTLVVNQGVGNHEVSGTVGFEAQNTFVKSISGSGRNALTNEVRVIGSVQDGINLGGSEGEDVLISYFGRVNYNYDGRYLLEGAIRRDGYSRFGPNDKWGVFPSVSAGWNVAEEAFMENLPVSELKLRGSWGLTGNNNALGRYEWQSTVGTGFRYNFNGNPVRGAGVPSLSNRDLRWETSQSINVGVDLGFFEQALTVSGEYYQNTTDDILLPISLPGSFGFPGGSRANTGSVETSGFEFVAGYQSRSAGAFNWSVNANFSTASNTVTSLGLGSPITGVNWGTGTNLANRVVEGQALWHYYGWKVDRIFQPSDFNEDGSLKEGIPNQPNAAPGDIKFQNVNATPNENGDQVINAEDRVDLGSPHPSYFYGLTAQATWKDIDVSLSLQGQGGNKILQQYKFWTQGMTRPFNAEADVLNRWTQENPNGDMPRAISGDPNNNARMSDRFLGDGDYLRLQRLTIGYDLPLQQLGVMQATVRSARIYLQSENLLTITGYEGYDPEVVGGGGDANFAVDDGTYVLPRTFLVGLQLSF